MTDEKDNVVVAAVDPDEKDEHISDEYDERDEYEEDSAHGEHADEDEEHEEDAPQSADNKKIYMIAGAVALLFGAGITGFMWLKMNGSAPQQASAPAIGQDLNQYQQQSAQHQDGETFDPMGIPHRSDQGKGKGMIANDERALSALQGGGLTSVVPQNQAGELNGIPVAPDAQANVPAGQPQEQAENDQLSMQTIDQQHGIKAEQHKEAGMGGDSISVAGTLAGIDKRKLDELSEKVEAAKNEVLEGVDQIIKRQQEEIRYLRTLAKDVRYIKSHVRASLIQGRHKKAKRNLATEERKANKDQDDHKLVQKDSQRWVVEGIEAGAAVLRNVQSGLVTVVLPGDMVSELGRILKIDPNKGIVVGSNKIAKGSSRI